MGAAAAIGIRTDDVVAYIAKRRLSMRQVAAAIPLSTRRLRQILAPGLELRDAEFERISAAIERLLRDAGDR